MQQQTLEFVDSNDLFFEEIMSDPELAHQVHLEIATIENEQQADNFWSQEGNHDQDRCECGAKWMPNPFRGVIQCSGSKFINGKRVFFNHVKPVSNA